MIKDAFNQTLQRYSLTAKRLSEESGVSENHISAFRRGVSDIGSKKLESLIEAMEAVAPGSKQYFCSQLASSSLKTVEWRSLILSASSQDIEEILRLLAERWAVVQKSESTDSFIDISNPFIKNNSSGETMI